MNKSNDEIIDELSYNILHIQSDPNDSKNLFKLLYNNPDLITDKNRNKYKHIFKFITTPPPSNTLFTGNYIKYLKIYTYWYGHIGSKTTFPTKVVPIIKYLINNCDDKRNKCTKFINQYIEISTLDLC